MKRSVLLWILLSVAFGYGRANETKVQFKDLPPAVQKTVQEQERNGAVVLGYSKEMENGKTFYEAETRLNNKSRDILVDVSGTVVEVEEAVSLASLPAAVQKVLRTHADSGKILSVESVTKGSTVSYEAVIQKNGRKSEIAVNADGTMKKEE